MSNENLNDDLSNDMVLDAKFQVGASQKGSIQQDIKRYRLIWAVVALAFCAIFARLVYIQIVNKDVIQKYGDKMITMKQQQPSYRGMIIDRHNMPLAVSAPLVTVVFSPRDYALEFYRLKAEEQKLMAEKPTDVITRRLESIRNRLENEMNLQKLSHLSNVPLDKLQKAVNLRTNVNFLTFFDEYTKVQKENSKIKLEKEQGIQTASTTKPLLISSLEEALPQGHGSSYMVLLKNVTPEEAQMLSDAKMVAVKSETNYQRYYPQPQPNAYLIGYMGDVSGNDKTKAKQGYQGRMGIEQMFDDMLSGQAGEKLLIKKSFEKLEQKSPEIAGKDLQLTIDSKLQYVLYQELEKVGIEEKARWAMGMVVDVPTGEVLAISNWPSFNPNDLSTWISRGSDGNGVINAYNRDHAMADNFEPGSVMKPFTIAIGLRSGQYTESSLINTSPGTLTIDDYTIRDSANYGVISLEKLLQKSSNVASAKISLSLPAETFSEGQKLFGFGQKTHLNFPLEAKGKVPTPTSKASRATVAYGYGMEVSLPQLAQAYNILGAGGVMHPLTLIKSTRDNALNHNNVESVVEPYIKPASTQIIKEKHAKAIVNMMVSVTEPGGTGVLASIDGYRVAGKSGTAKIAKEQSENIGVGYHDNKYRTLFAGVAPASNPRFTVVIVVEDPQKGQSGGKVAAPVFRNVMKEALRLYNVPYDKPLTGKEPTVADANVHHD